MIKFVRFLTPFRLQITVVVILTFIKTLSDLYLPTLLADIIDIGIVNEDIPFIIRIGGWMLFIAAIGVGAIIMSSYISSFVAAGFSRDLRNALFKHVESFSLNEFDQFGTATLITRTTNDVNQVQQVLLMMLRMMISAPIMGLGGVIMAASKDLYLSIIVVGVVPVLTIAMLLVGRKVMPLFKSLQVKLDKLNLVLREALTGIRVIRAFNRMEHEGERFHDVSRDLADTTIKANSIMAVLMPMMIFIINITTLAIIWFGAIRINTGNMAIGDVLAFTQYLMLIMFAVMMFAMMFIMIPRASASAIRINEILEVKPEMMDEDLNSEFINQNTKAEEGKVGEAKVKEGKVEEKIVDKMPIEAINKDNEVGEIKGVVEFKDVTFTYHGAQESAIKNISFKAKPREVTAIIGGTGSGKSTLINLIPRFYDVESGQILVDHIDVKNIKQEALRNRIGLVPQKNILFRGSIVDNIRFGKEKATKEEVNEVIKSAQASDFVEHMPEGCDTLLAQGGTNISGGQKQRLAIARALIKKPDIYIFDDSFSALDFKTERKLRNELKRIAQNATVIIVAQRVATIMDADRILVLEEGKLVGNGSHKDLLKTCKVYQEIAASQLSQEELA